MLRYQSYVLRVWRGSRRDRHRWSARLEGLQDGQHQRFADLDTLLAALRGLLAADALDSPAAGEGTASSDPLPDPRHVSGEKNDGKGKDR